MLRSKQDDKRLNSHVHLLSLGSIVRLRLEDIVVISDQELLGGSSYVDEFCTRRQFSL